MISENSVGEIVNGLSRVSDDVNASFAKLSAEQLNWKPSPESWSVGQCLDHLITTNRSYHQGFDEVINGSRVTRFMERLPVLPGLFGNLLVKSLDPDATRKLKAPGAFQASSSAIPVTIISDFMSQQDETIRRMKACESMQTEKIIITSPALSLITYSLMDAFKILLTHERRHVKQAKNVTQTPGFPI
jgi:hypothetical protein